jgi:hypothetical protein
VVDERVEDARLHESQHEVGRPARHADVLCETLPLHLHECLDGAARSGRRLERRVLGIVDEEHGNPVDAESFEGLLEAPPHLLAAEVTSRDVAVDLRLEHDRVIPDLVPEQVADQLLADPTPVDVRRVDEVDRALRGRQREVGDASQRGGLVFTPSNPARRAETERRHADAGAPVLANPLVVTRSCRLLGHASTLSTGPVIE